MTEDLSQLDRDALQLAIDLCLANDPPNPGRPDQIRDKLRDRDWFDVACFCSYVQQMTRLALDPGMSPPCWVLSESTADEILAEGMIPASDDTTVDISNCRSARTLKLMLLHNISPYHPHPVSAIAAAKRARPAT
jgi:hypothetical protein